MPSNSNLVYALAAMTALTLGLGVSFWRSSAENKNLLQANLAAGAALEKAQDDKKMLREKLLRETKAREVAEAARTVAETSERATREKLMLETKAKRAAEAAHLEAEAQLEAAALKFAQEAKARTAAEEAQAKTGAALETANAELAQEREAREAAELSRDQAVETITGLTVKLNEEVAARNAVQDALTEAEDRVGVLSAKIAGQMADGEKAVIMKMAAPAPLAGAEIAEAADEVRDGASDGARVPSAEVRNPNQIPATLVTGEPKAQPEAGTAPLVQASDLSRRNLAVQ